MTEPFLMWDDLQACVPKWWQFRKRYQARRFYREMQKWSDDIFQNPPHVRRGELRSDSVIDALWEMEQAMRKHDAQLRNTDYQKGEA